MCKTIVVRITWTWDNGKGSSYQDHKDINVVLSPTDPTFVEYASIIYGGKVELNKYIKHLRDKQIDPYAPIDSSYSVKDANIELLSDDIKIDSKQCKIRTLEHYGKTCSDNCIIIVLCIPTENGGIFEFPIGKLCVSKQGANHTAGNIFAAGESLYPIVVLTYLHNLPNGECLTFSEEQWNHYPSLAEKLEISRSLDENKQGIYVLTNKLV